MLCDFFLRGGGGGEGEGGKRREGGTFVPSVKHLFALCCASLHTYLLHVRTYFFVRYLLLSSVQLCTMQNKLSANSIHPQQRCFLGGEGERGVCPPVSKYLYTCMYVCVAPTYCCCTCGQAIGVSVPFDVYAHEWLLLSQKLN